MAQAALPVLSQSVTADTAASPNTIAMRDSAGNMAAAQLLGTELKSSGRLTLKSSTKTSNFTVDPTAVSTYFVDATAGAVTAALPSAVGLLDAIVTIAKVDSSGNAVTVTGGIANSLATQGASSRWQSDNAAWQKIG